jgi:hypothetical protein
MRGPRVQSPPRSFLPTTFHSETFDHWRHRPRWRARAVPGSYASSQPKSGGLLEAAILVIVSSTRRFSSLIAISVLLSYPGVSLRCDGGRLPHVIDRYTRCFLSRRGHSRQARRLVLLDRGAYSPGCHRAQRNWPVAHLKQRQSLPLPDNSRPQNIQGHRTSVPAS